MKNISGAIDLIGIDRDGNLVGVELKKGSLSGDVDFQSLKYAAYTSHWSRDKVRKQFESFRKTEWGRSLYDEDASFTEALEGFCNDEYSLNMDQRILLVGESIREHLDLVMRWLSNRNIDVTVVEIQLLEDDGRTYLYAEQAIPVPGQSDADMSPDASEEPWKAEGRRWQLKERSNEMTAGVLEEFAAAIGEIESLDDPQWGRIAMSPTDRIERSVLRSGRKLRSSTLIPTTSQLMISIRTRSQTHSVSQART